MDKNALGSKIKRLRERHGLSQDRLATESGVARNGINDLEQGRGNPTIGTLEALSLVLGEPLVSLFEERQVARAPIELGPAARLLVRLDQAPLIRAVVFAIALGEEDHIDSLDLRAVVKQFRSKLGSP